MWDPNQAGSELIREFTRGMFGPENAEKMALIYEAVEKAAAGFARVVSLHSRKQQKGLRKGCGLFKRQRPLLTR